MQKNWSNIKTFPLIARTADGRAFNRAADNLEPGSKNVALSHFSITSSPGPPGFFNEETVNSFFLILYKRKVFNGLDFPQYPPREKNRSAC